MNEIEKHVEKLFKSYRKNKQNQELKEEVYANLLARKEDLLLEGYQEEEAVRIAIIHIDSVDHLIENNKKVDINRFFANLLQSATLYSVIIWLFTLPLSLYPQHFLLTYFFLGLSILLSIAYIMYLKKLRSDDTKIKYMNSKSMQKLQKIIWQLWSGFIIISLLSVTGLYFASNFWFSRPLLISGPYQFGEIIISYFTPFFTIIIPLTINKAVNLIDESELGIDEKI
ncbi:permease prefix domain 1-containing protein [Marinilactibacillus kalidii]|uniref:permease prefix domain 1-containing protein n=1 Tax=Marinilactibacillus kalidii TaxID=2820274 RepID=UPI001ABE5AD2|nr:permease prefix domain 1-containing protein [Marinilactibacillus kalidii]